MNTTAELAPVETVPSTDSAAQRLRAARDALLSTTHLYDSLMARARQLEEAAEIRLRRVAVAEAPRHQKRNLIASILRRDGAVGEAEKGEISALDKMIAAAGPEIETATLEAEEFSAMAANVQSEMADVGRGMKPLHDALAVAQFDAARHEIESDALPAFLDAVETLRRTYARLVGLGKAHTTLYSQLISKGVDPMGSALGTQLPITEWQLSAAGFGLEERLRSHPTLRGHSFSVVSLPAAPLIQETADTALRRWQAA